MSIILMTPQEVALSLAKRLQERRLALNLSQFTLAEHSGVSYGALKKFEQTGKISLDSLLKIALALGCLQDFTTLFKNPPPKNLPTLDALFAEKTRKRGRK